MQKLSDVEKLSFPATLNVFLLILIQKSGVKGEVWLNVAQSWVPWYHMIKAAIGNLTSFDI